MDVGDGTDAHALVGWRGPVLYTAKSVNTLGDGRDVGRCCGLVNKYMQAHPGSVAVDGIGVGAGVVSNLKAVFAQVHRIMWGLPAKDPIQYANLKAEDYFIMREAFERGEVAIAPLGDEVEDELMTDLSQLWYEFTPKGAYKIESKKETKKRLGRSPNLGDACALGHRARAAIGPPPREEEKGDLAGFLEAGF